MEDSFLLVPIHVDALYLKEEENVLEPMNNFTQLPYYYKGKSINSDKAYISENITLKPFTTPNLTLHKGIHLFWSLPDALLNKLDTEEFFPEVPNRWLIIRRKNGVEEEKWMIESDYLYEPDYKRAYGDTHVPVKGSPPFRYIGRKLSYEEWTNSFQGNQNNCYYAPFTGVGYGIPEFSGFYPNCKNVFGFYDSDYTDTIPDGLEYEMIGFYASKESDYLRNFIEKQRIDNNEQLLELMEERFHWTFTEDGNSIPDNTICYSFIKFQPNSDSSKDKNNLNNEVTISIGNTGTEALSAFLADQLIARNYFNSLNPNQIEEELDFIISENQLDKKQLDLDARFKEAHHLNGFYAKNAGTSFHFVRKNDNTDSVKAEDMPETADLQLPQELTEKLEGINSNLQVYQKSCQEIESMKQQLYSDWYKYMVCMYNESGGYPDINDIKSYVENHSIRSLEEKISNTGELTDKNPELSREQYVTSNHSFADQISCDIMKLTDKINDYNRTKSEKEKIELQKEPNQRFWVPKEPCILLQGDYVQPTDRYGADGRENEKNQLLCQVLTLPLENNSSNETIFVQNATKIIKRIDEIITETKDQNIAFRLWETQPWHPIMLEWQVQMFPIKKDDTAANSGRLNYREDFITRHYQLLPGECDLVYKNAEVYRETTADIYSGSILLTENAAIQLQKSLEQYFMKEQVLEQYDTDNKIPETGRNRNELKKQIGQIKEWYGKKHSGTDLSRDAIYIAICTYELLTTSKVLSQCLSGFHNALIMKKQTYQLSIGDPNAFASETEFIAHIRDLVGNQNMTAPEPLQNFQPIRSGAMLFNQVRLIDVFGRCKDLTIKSTHSNHSLSMISDSLITLPPRIVQPARLNFRWLPSVEKDTGLLFHSDTLPICGFILPNDLDQSLMFYDSNGQSVGYLNQNAEWNNTPDSRLNSINEVTNQYLKNFMEYIIKLGSGFFSDFLNVLDLSYHHIHSEEMSGNQGMLLWIGHPIALVRASIGLELYGTPVCDQSWDSFRKTLEKKERETESYEAVNVPIRIGALEQYHDGLLGFWIEDPDGYRDNQFYASCQPEETDNQYIKSASEKVLLQPINGKPQSISLLIDPGCSIHATSGVLPVKSIRISSKQYTKAFQSIEASFLTAPVITEELSVNLSLPVETSYYWNWLYKNKQEQWQVLDNLSSIQKEAVEEKIIPFNDTLDRIKKSVIREGWLKLKHKNPVE